MYLPLVPKEIKQAVDKTLQKIKKIKRPYRYIVCTGYSGALIAGFISVKLKKEIIIVRKPSDSSHGHVIESDQDKFLYDKNERGNRRSNYVIIDDFIVSGETIRRIIETCSPHKLTCIGVVRYKDDHDLSPTEQLMSARHRIPIL